MTHETRTRISVTSKDTNNFTIHQGFIYIAGITPAWIRYSAPHLFHNTAELHRLITLAFTSIYEGVNAARITPEQRNALNTLALENFRHSARQKSYVPHNADHTSTYIAA